MTSSLPAIWHRIVLVLLLPLWMQTKSLYELAVATNITGAILAAFREKPTDRNLLKRIVAAAIGSWLASFIADFVVFGPWMKLCMTYLCSWVALWYLIPNLAANHKVCLVLVVTGDYFSLLHALTQM